MYLEQDHQRCSEKQCNRCTGGLAPIKGWEKGMDFPGRKKQPDGKEMKEGYPVALLHDV